MNYQELLKTHRRELHKIPELGRELPKTKAYILSVLEKLDCQIIQVLESGVCAYFHREAQTTTAFRADMDGLPVAEANTHSFVSLHQGQMHACGHDGHMAMGLAFTQYVNEEKQLSSNVLMVFQPAEETIGGAKDICETGIFEKYNVDRIFGIHLWPFIKGGAITSRSGAMMPRSSEITVEVQGKTSHATSPEEGIDALYIACRFIDGVYKAKAEQMSAAPIDPQEKTIIQFCKLESGTARNIISGHSSILGTMRAFSEETFAKLLGILETTAAQLEKEYGCKISISHSEGYPPVINTPELYEKIRPILDTLDYTEMPEPAMISEDYSFYGHYAPAVFFFLGTGTGIALHSTNFDFDEEILMGGFQLYKSLLR